MAMPAKAAHGHVAAKRAGAEAAVVVLLGDEPFQPRSIDRSAAGVIHLAPSFSRSFSAANAGMASDARASAMMSVRCMDGLVGSGQWSVDSG